METILNEKQLIAAHHIKGPLLVLAGAGSGKTRVVTHRIAHLINMGILPEHILAVTFTNKAADEMRKRIYDLTRTSILASTFHSLGAKILRESITPLGFSSNFTIYDEDDSLKMIRTCVKELQIKETLIKNIKHQISSAKNSLLLPHQIDQTEKTPIEKAFIQIYPLYQEKMRKSNALDFDDLLLYPYLLFEQFSDIKKEYQNRFLFVLVDEYQDTNYAQYMLTKTLVDQHQNIFVVGDPDQSIYSWRGARYENILRFDEDFKNAQVVHLEKNYRSTNTILKAANALIQNNENRYEKNLWSDLGEGEKIKLYFARTEQDEARFIVQQIIDHHNKNIALDEIVIFYRTNAQSRIFEEILIAKKIPYVIYGGISFYQRKEIKDILAFLRIALTSSDVISFIRTLNIPKRNLGAATIEKLLHYATQENKTIISFLHSFLQNPSNYPMRIMQKQLKGLQDYLHIIESLQKVIHEHSQITQILLETLDITKYYTYLKEDLETFDDRKENIEQLIAKTTFYDENEQNPTLAQFLEELSLASDVKQSADTKALKLMTLHNGKGLEFPVVFIAGLEEDLFPHANSKNSYYELEEERRLCYVGMTRAKKHLYLSACASRFLWGGHHFLQPSRFLREIPEEFIENLSSCFTSPNRAPTPEILEKDTSEEGFRQGDRVSHAVFGSGKIVKTYHTSFGLTYDVFFLKDHTTRSLVAQYAHLSSEM